MKEVYGRLECTRLTVTTRLNEEGGDVPGKNSTPFVNYLFFESGFVFKDN